MGNDALQPAGASGRRTLRQRAIEELRRYLILLLYLWVLFGLFVLNEDIVKREQGGNFVFQGFALLNAFVLAKVMLMAEDLKLARWLKGRPMVLTILFEAVLSTLLFIAAHALERIVVGALRGDQLSASMPGLAPVSPDTQAVAV